MRGLATFVMRGPMQAGMVAASSLVLSLVIPPSLWVGGAAVALYALRRGFAAGLTAAGVAAAGTVALLWFSLGQGAAGLLLALTLWVPLLAAASILRATVRLEWSLLAAAAFGLVVVLFIYVLVEQPVEMWYEGLSQALPADRVQAEFGIPAADFDPQAWEELLREIAGFMTGFTGAALALNTVVSLLLARWWQALLFNPGGFGEEFRELRLGRSASAIALAVLAAAWLLDSDFFSNIAVVVVGLYLFQGLAVIHGLVKQRNAGRGWLITLYVLLFFAFMKIVLVIALFGILDAWTDLRRRWAVPPPS